jgi:hypothetical protein
MGDFIGAVLEDETAGDERWRYLEVSVGNVEGMDSER